MRCLSFWMTLMLIGLFICPGGSNIDIDYSHDIKGTGTLITDYSMDDSQSSQAIGKIRGTGDIMNKYLFISRNDSENITIQDQFVLSKRAALYTKPLLIDYPKRPAGPANFRLVGPSWAKGIEVPERGASETSQMQPGAFHNLEPGIRKLPFGRGYEALKPPAITTTSAIGLYLMNFNESLSLKNRIEFDYNSSLLKGTDVVGVKLKRNFI